MPLNKCYVLFTAPIKGEQTETRKRRCRRKQRQQKPMKNFHKTEPFLFPEYGAHSAGKHLFIDDSTLIPVCP